MTVAAEGELLRASIFHTPRNPFTDDCALEIYMDGGLLIRNGRVAACGDFSALRAAYPDPSTDLRGGVLLPGLVDTHVHFPQVFVLGNLGHSLLDWLEQCALPEEIRMEDTACACETARAFLLGLVSHGTTTALVFGAHFKSATATLFEFAANAGLRVIAGLVLSDRLLGEELHQTPESAYRDSSALIQRFDGIGRLHYAVTPRFALSASEAMLEVCQTLILEHPTLRFQTHLNESLIEIEQVGKLFPWASDYLAVYERFGLANRNAVMAHNVHATSAEMERLAAAGATIAHCPASNAALGSGTFALRRHIQAGVRCSLGTDVGGGTGFGMLKEGLQAYLVQRLAPDGYPLTAAHLLYLATLAGAQALGLENEIGDFTTGKAADFVYIRPPAGSPLAEIVRRAENPERILAALFTLAGAESIRQVRIEGSMVYEAQLDEAR